MPRRQKLILLVMIVTMAYGVFELFFAPPSKKGLVDQGAESKALNKLIIEISETLAKESVTESDLYILSKAQAEWGGDPFLASVPANKPDAAKKQEPSEGDEKVPFTYSGYVDMGKKKLAIINGVEYEIGEELRSAGYIVERIESTRVILKGKQKSERLIVPIREHLL